jgi:2-methylcitrate dehydratase
MQTTLEVAKRICATSFTDIPSDVVSYSKALILSGLGSMIAGATRADGEIIARYVKRMGGNPDATVFGTPIRTSAESAALANANFAHSTEYEDDSFPEAVSSYTIHPAVFAMAEMLKASGKDVITAFVVGYETQARIALACTEARKRGILALSCAGTLGCAAAVAKLLKLDVEKTTMALSIAASQASGIARQSGTLAHYFEMGIAARNGVSAALLAADGFTGQPDIFEGPRGLFDIITAGVEPTTADVVGAWGKPFRVMEVGIKRYPCCFRMAGILDATSDLKREHKLTANDVDEIQVDVNLFFPESVRFSEPRDEVEAQFSLNHAIAAVMLEDKITLDSFRNKTVHNETYRAMREKVKMVVREEWGSARMGWTPIVTMKLRNGSTLQEARGVAVGQPPDLLGFPDAVEKYRLSVGRYLDESRIRRSSEMVRDLESIPDICSVIREVSKAE